MRWGWYFTLNTLIREGLKTLMSFVTLCTEKDTGGKTPHEHLLFFRSLKTFCKLLIKNLELY